MPFLDTRALALTPPPLPECFLLTEAQHLKLTFTLASGKELSQLAACASSDSQRGSILQAEDPETGKQGDWRRVTLAS